MNPFERPLQEFLDALEGVGIGYMIVGSFASNLYGAPRATQDVDIVIEPNLGKLSRLLSVLGTKGFYTPPIPVVERALHAEKPFNLIHIDTGFKVDLVPRRKRPFSAEEFSRRHYVEFLGKPRAFATPEDTLLAKLEWAKRGGSARQIEDALAIVMGVGKLDREYLKKWAQELGVRELLEEVERKAERRQSEGV